MQPDGNPACSEASELSAVVLEHHSECENRSSVTPANVRAVERALLVQRQVPFARRVLSVVVEPDFGGVVGLATVDVEEFA